MTQGRYFGTTDIKADIFVTAPNDSIYRVDSFRLLDSTTLAFNYELTEIAMKVNDRHEEVEDGCEDSEEFVVYALDETLLDVLESDGYGHIKQIDKTVVRALDGITYTLKKWAENK